jgi:chemotaxis protein MotB
MAADTDQPIIIKRIKKSKHAAHGGAWKIAYADFVTAMMAFFLLLWLISMTTPEQKKGIADYFAPPNVSESTSGAGGVLGGTAYDQLQAKLSGSNTDAKTQTSPDSKRKTGPMVAVRGGADANDKSLPQAAKAPAYASSSEVDLQSHFDQSFEGAAASIMQAWHAMPDITDVAASLVLQQTKQGLNIKIEDQNGRPMFVRGSKELTADAKEAIAAIAPVLQRLPNQISISGFTQAGIDYADPQYGPWELSSDRANEVRDVLGQFGLSNDHIASVTGRGTAEPLFPNDPYLSANDRVEITLLYQNPPAPPGLAP